MRVNSIFYVCEMATQAGGTADIRNLDREKKQFDKFQRKWGSDIVKYDKTSKKGFDINPIIKIPIKGV